MKQQDGSKRDPAHTTVIFNAACVHGSQSPLKQFSTMSMKGRVAPILELLSNAVGGYMRHESNWLEYLRKLANEPQQPAAQQPRAADVRSPGIVHISRDRQEWLQAGYSAQLSLPFRSSH
jgi:hypothetical protein